MARTDRLALTLAYLVTGALAFGGCGGGGGDDAGSGDAGHDGSTLDGGPDADDVGHDGDADVGGHDGGDGGQDAADADGGDGGDGGDVDADGGDADAGGGLETPFVVVTFNTGTGTEMLHDLPPDDGYTSDHAELSDQYYGNGLAWLPAVEATTAFFADLDPDIVVFQEIFHSEECAEIPADARQDFVCESWSAGDPTVAQVVVGAGFQVMCNPGNPDKCAAVNRSFGSFRGCDEDLCIEGMVGFRVDGCGGGARVGRAIIDLASGGTLTLVNFHGSSGVDGDSMDCRVEQVNQVFVDLGDGEPGANGEVNLVMGDLNVDPGREALLDPSARRWNNFVGPRHDFHFVTDIGFGATPTYSGLLNIDHVISDLLDGDCWVAGTTAGHPAVIDATYFDHKPHVCTVSLATP